MITKDLCKKWSVCFTNKNGEERKICLTGGSLDEVKDKFMSMSDEFEFVGSLDDVQFRLEGMSLVQYWG